MDDDSYCTSIQLVDIEEPSHLDVLCGRGLGTNRHNTYFRNLVQSKQVREHIVQTRGNYFLHTTAFDIQSALLYCIVKELYAKSTKSEKMAITRSIVQVRMLFLYTK
jgi:hypothetical protein